MDSVAGERKESLKAGALAALSFSIAYGLVALVNRLILAESAPFPSQVPDFWLEGLIAPLSGFLFGVTYRYIIRKEQNSHLKDGAVLAFGLVRGLALVEVTDNLTQKLEVLSLLGSESIFCFAIARFMLDLALERSWIKPFS